MQCDFSTWKINSMDKPIIIVVEGITDKQLLESFMDCEIVTTNGSSVPRGTIEYLKKLQGSHHIIIFTDPDGPGEKIRSQLNQELPGAQNVFIPKNLAIKRGKVGVAESDIPSLKKALEHIIPNTYKVTDSDLTSSTLYQFDLLGSQSAKSRREKLCQNLGISYTNAKTLLRRLTSLGIKKDDLERLTYEL